MSSFNDLAEKLAERNPKLYKGKINEPLPDENVTCYMIPGAVTSSIANGKRQGLMQVTFDSVSTNNENAYSNLLSIQEEILQNTDHYDSEGFEFSLEGIQDIEDISFIQANSYVYRYIFTIEVFYFRSVV